MYENKSIESKIIEFHKFIILARSNFNFDLNQFGNMNEVILKFDVVLTFILINCECKKKLRQ